MLLDEYQKHQRRLIVSESRRSKSLSELQGRLKERGIKMKFTDGKNQKIVFAVQRNYRIDSKLGKDRAFTDIARKNVDRNAKLHVVKTQDIKPPKEKAQDFDKAREKRAQKSTERTINKAKSLQR